MFYLSWYSFHCHLSRYSVSCHLSVYSVAICLDIGFIVTSQGIGLVVIYQGKWFSSIGYRFLCSFSAYKDVICQGIELPSVRVQGCHVSRSRDVFYQRICLVV